MTKGKTNRHLNTVQRGELTENISSFSNQDNGAYHMTAASTALLPSMGAALVALLRLIQRM
jgi:hypothetical protein